MYFPQKSGENYWAQHIKIGVRKEQPEFHVLIALPLIQTHKAQTSKSSQQSKQQVAKDVAHAPLAL